MGLQNVQITVLIENKKNNTNKRLEAKHGLSVYVTATIDKNKVSVLMDAGPSAEKLLNNINQLGINLEDVDVIVLSHAHYDHTGGLIDTLKHVKKRVPVIAHPTLFNPKLSMMPSLRLIGTTFRITDIENVDGLPILASNPVKIADGLTTTGEVPRTTNFETVKGFWTIQEKKFTNDTMLDDQSLVLDVENKGLIVVSGCAHSGIINTLTYAQQITGNNKVYAVIGGFHLIGASENKIEKTIAELKKLNPTVIAPCHCTGKNAIKKIAEEFKDRFIPIETGSVINF